MLCAYCPVIQSIKRYPKRSLRNLKSAAILEHKLINRFNRPMHKGYKKDNSNQPNHSSAQSSGKPRFRATNQRGINAPQLCWVICLLWGWSEPGWWRLAELAVDLKRLYQACVRSKDRIEHLFSLCSVPRACHWKMSFKMRATTTNCLSYWERLCFATGLIKTDVNSQSLFIILKEVLQLFSVQHSPPVVTPTILKWQALGTLYRLINVQSYPLISHRLIKSFSDQTASSASRHTLVQDQPTGDKSPNHNWG